MAVFPPDRDSPLPTPFARSAYRYTPILTYATPFATLGFDPAQAAMPEIRVRPPAAK